MESGRSSNSEVSAASECAERSTSLRESIEAEPFTTARMEYLDRFISTEFGRYVSAVLLASLLTVNSGTSFAQTKKKSPRKPQQTLNERVAKAKNDVIAAANEYKVSLQKLVAFQEDDVKSAAETVEKRKALLTQNIISRKEVEESEHALAAAQVKVNVTKGQIAEADSLIAEATGEAQLAKLGPSRAGSYQTTAALIRYNGPSSWVLTDAAKVESFFASKFHHSMPISAFGQTAVHDHLGFDHHNSVDVALSPDSAEGQALMTYLRSVGIPFIAFRHAVPGSATGAHIHIGYPSRRIAK